MRGAGAAGREGPPEHHGIHGFHCVKQGTETQVFELRRDMIERPC